jgi:hypothetical protein
VIYVSANNGCGLSVEQQLCVGSVYVLASRQDSRRPFDENGHQVVSITRMESAVSSELVPRLKRVLFGAANDRELCHSVS